MFIDGAAQGKAGPICFVSSASTRSTTSKRPKVAKLPFQVMSGHCFLIFADTSAARSLNLFGSSNASWEK